MKCYLCGEDGSHLVQCPVNKKEPPKKESAFSKPTKPIENDWVENVISGVAPLKGYVVPPLRKKKAFISLTEQVPSAMFDHLAVYHIRRQPVLNSKPYRLWVDEQVAGFFEIIDVTIKVSEQLNACYDMKGVPANLFRTGRWPLPPFPDKDVEWGIDLESWETIPVTGYLDIRVRNNCPNSLRFQAALEVWTVD